jgi:nitrous oxidase accessory protein NosD
MIIVNKSISLVGENKNTTILEGNYEFTPIVEVAANSVTITGFTLQHSAHIMGPQGGGILISGANGTRVIGNIIKNAQYCVNLYMTTTDNLVVDNVLAILGDYYGNGIQCLYSSGNVIYHNTFINSYGPAFHACSEGYSNIWDNGYPDGGNFWPGYTGVDLFSGPYQNVTGSDGIGDTPYVIDVINQDRYPLMRASDPLEGDINLDGKVYLKDVFAVAKAYGSHPGDPNWNIMCDINNDMKVDLKDYFATCKNYGKQW